MTKVAEWLPDIYGQLMEHTYGYSSFGSWLFTFKKSGQTYRVVYDGKENDLRLELGKYYLDKKHVNAWEKIELIRFQEPKDKPDQQIIFSLIERNT